MWEFTCWSGRKGKNIISHCSSNLHNFEEEENKKHLMQEHSHPSPQVTIGILRALYRFSQHTRANVNF